MRDAGVHTGKLDMLRSIGADEVIDYTREDFTQRGNRFHALIDIPGNHPFSECRRVLTPAGTYLLIGHGQYGARGHRVLGSIPQVFRLMAMSSFVKQLISSRTSPCRRRQGRWLP